MEEDYPKLNSISPNKRDSAITIQPVAVPAPLETTFVKPLTGNCPQCNVRLLLKLTECLFIIRYVSGRPFNRNLFTARNVMDNILRHLRFVLFCIKKG